MSQLRDHREPPSPPTTAFATTTTTIAANTSTTESTVRINNGNGVDTVVSKGREEEAGNRNNLRENANRGNLRR